MSDAGTYRLLGAEVSLYTGKARAYLRYKAIPFREVLATAQVYNDVIVPQTGVRYVPVVISPDGVAVQDTTEIIDFLEARFPAPSVYPETPVPSSHPSILNFGRSILARPAPKRRAGRGRLGARLLPRRDGPLCSLCIGKAYRARARTTLRAR